ncbi:protein-glutamate O-methyltransferase CheR [Trichocoleus sp. FACHB-262]|uniref:CheR family methyltransferase n=1 Tax=Trichocoleus sp. FACHB-262 TaxID=2692869 RepID=UPI001688790A|nr:protein-glutamate O-methyltransferase CheR [Trichocoleus sp. FACHB-262]MBD2122799.1 tetratricopeptide repeat protein [Trichocoleus sp. FACHB-262]
MPPIQDKFQQALTELIAARTGLQIRLQDQPNIYKKILSRMQSLKISELAQYYKLLEMPTPQSDREWQELIILLTTGESYLFRDQGQISLLKNKILPELIDYRKDLKVKQGKSKASLKIWSAGCSTGEEAYSLAILVHELLPRQDDWNITILGTDINPEAIKKAKKGSYSSWSFRTFGAELQQQYFSPHRSGWEINPKIRERVKFYPGNLIQDKLPNPLSDICDLDLILCRNVFIYFDAAAIAIVLQKFYDCLRPGGYLITGHAELYNQELTQFQTQIWPESVVYQRRISSTEPNANLARSQTHQLGSQELKIQRSPTQEIKPVGKEAFPANSLPSSEVGYKSTYKTVSELDTNSQANSKASTKIHLALYQASLTQAENLLRDGLCVLALQAASQAIKYDSISFDAYYLMAQAHANLGQYQEAKNYCQRAISLDIYSIKPYYLLAKVSEEEGDIESAKSILKKIIYLDPKAIAAYLDLGAIYARENDIIRSAKMRSTALDLLKQISPDTTVEYQNHSAAGDLLLYVKKLLNKNT